MPIYHDLKLQVYSLPLYRSTLLLYRLIHYTVKQSTRITSTLLTSYIIEAISVALRLDKQYGSDIIKKSAIYLPNKQPTLLTVSTESCKSCGDEPHK